jgi:Condensation domain
MVGDTVGEQLLVPFRGEGSGVADLTWGQAGIWQSIQQTGQSRTLGGVSTLTPGYRVEDAAETLRFIMSRHQALRTRFPIGPDGTPRQECAESGEIALEIVDADDAEPAEVAAALHQRYQEKHFDYPNEWPVRMALVRHRGVPVYMVAVYLHLVIDATGLTVLIADIRNRNRSTGAAPPVTAMPPLEQARRQASPAGQRQCATSLQYLEHVLRTVPPSRFGPPRYGGEPDFRMLRYRSPATLLAARALAARNATNTSPVMLAIFGIALARYTGKNPVLAVLTVSNRFRPGFAESVSSVAQISPFMIDVADVSVDEAITRAAQSTLNAYKNAYSNPYLQDEVWDRVNRERGAEVELSCYYNDRRQESRDAVRSPVPTAAEIQAALPASRPEWVQDLEMPGSTLYLYVDDAPDAVEFELSGDTRYFAPADLEALVRGMEAVAVGAALDPAAATGVSAVAAVV